MNMSYHSVTKADSWYFILYPTHLH